MTHCWKSHVVAQLLCTLHSFPNIPPSLIDFLHFRKPDYVMLACADADAMYSFTVHMYHKFVSFVLVM